MSKLQNQLTKQNSNKPMFSININEIKANNIREKSSQTENNSTNDDTKSLGINEQGTKKDNINNKKSFHEIAKNKDEKSQVSEELLKKEKKNQKVKLIF